ncbi:histidine kinase [Streptomyces capparidis]
MRSRGITRPGGEPGGGGAAGAGGWLWWPRRRGAVLDIGLALASTAECVAEGVDFAHRVGVPVLPFVLLGLLAGPVLVVRRRWPVAVMLVSLAVTPAKMGVLLGIIGVYTLAASAVPRRVTFSLAGLNALGAYVVAVYDLRGSGGPEDEMSLPALLLSSFALVAGVAVAPMLLGLYVGARRRLVESLVDRADGLEQELALLAEKAQERAQRARIEERTRIAREMHDVVAHRVSLMVVHAGALQALVGRDPERAARNAELLGDLGRQALEELRQMLGVLRATEDAAKGVPEPVAAPAAGAAAGAVPPTGDGTAEDPAPEEDDGGSGPVLGDVEKLVEASRAAGMAVDLSVEGELRPVAVESERTAYRVVQEALTNVHKHAPGAKALVRVAYREEEVAVLVENGPSDGRPSAALPSGGNGLVGMRERVTALGGGFVAGPRQGGGFRVSALLPAAPRR